MSFCLSCQKLIPGGYKELAYHIISSKKGHRRGRKWAAGVICQVRRLDRRATQISRNKNRLPMTEEQKEAKKNLVREVSGQFQKVTAWCPKGKHNHMADVDVEFLESPNAWKLGEKPVIFCESCR